MELRKEEMKKDELFALRLFDEAEYAFIASINNDNTPYCIPVSLAVCNNVIYIHGSKSGQKVMNYKNNPNICMTCVGKTKVIPEKFTTEYESAVLSGKIEIVEEKDEKIFAMKKICEKYSKDYMHLADKVINASMDRLGVYKINIEKISAKAKKY